jgi:hypothetical protein
MAGGSRQLFHLGFRIAGLFKRNGSSPACVSSQCQIRGLEGNEGGSLSVSATYRFTFPEIRSTNIRVSSSTSCGSTPFSSNFHRKEFASLALL